jgi:hypothetical protein
MNEEKYNIPTFCELTMSYGTRNEIKHKTLKKKSYGDNGLEIIVPLVLWELRK